MPPKKKSINAFSVYMMEKQQELSKRGIKMNLAEMSVYCKDDWESMSDEKKLQYKEKSKKMKDENTVGKYTSIGEKVEDVIRKSEECILQKNAMYSYIEELVRMDTAGYYLSKQKIIFIHINAYTCDKECYYFPAEISMAEFSLERGLIRIFHEIIGLDKERANAPLAPTADINNHAKNNHQITLFNKLPMNYTDVLLKIIGFIINKEVDETVLSDSTLDMPPIYTAHSSTGNELMITITSLFQLYKSAVSNASRDDFNNLLKVYHLDKLFMELKNVSHKIRFPKRDEKALPSVAMATESLSKDMFNTIISIGCSFHEKLEHAHVCSNYYVCKWIYIISTHCCQYFDIKLVAGCHYDFDLSKSVAQIEENFDNLNITTKKETYYLTEKKPQNLTINSFPALDNGLSTIIQPSVWSKPKQKIDFNSTVRLNTRNNFPPLGNLQKTTPETQRGRSIIQTQNSNAADEESGKPWGKKFNFFVEDD